MHWTKGANKGRPIEEDSERIICRGAICASEGDRVDEWKQPNIVVIYPIVTPEHSQESF